MLISKRIFLDPPPQPPKKWAVAENFFQNHSKYFQSLGSAIAFLQHIFTPKSHRWSFAGAGKSGTSSTLLFLFSLEFGSNLSVQFNDSSDINTHSTIHKAKDLGIFRSLFNQAATIDIIEKTNRFAIVRHPINRAVSSFLYFCKSNELASAWLLRDRLWINAAMGFDWKKDPGTVNGFIKFLDYIELILETGQSHLVNSHWRPQNLNIVPAVYQPGVVGRLEEFDNFARKIADRLDIRFNENLDANTHANKQAPYDSIRFIEDPAVIRKIQKIYKEDFDLFEYASTS